MKNFKINILNPIHGVLIGIILTCSHSIAIPAYDVQYVKSVGIAYGHNGTNYLEVVVPQNSGTVTYTFQIDGNSQTSIQKGNSLYAALLAAVATNMKARILYETGTLALLGVRFVVP